MKIKKIDAAKRQLDTAIQLWFQEADAVSVHTLVYAAYEIIHVVSKRRGRKETLIFDSEIVRPNAKALWAQITKGSANFFKHAKDDFDAEIDFDPKISESFIAMSIFGLDLCGEPRSLFSAAFFLWLMIHKPDLFTDDASRRINDLVGVKPKGLLNLSRTEFLKRFIEVNSRTARK